MIIELQVIDYEHQNEQTAFFGKVVCKADVRGWSPQAIEAEKEDLLFHFGGDRDHISIVEVEEIPAA